VGSNGENACTEVLAAGESVYGEAELSTNRLFWQVMTVVPDTAAKALVAGVKLDVYKAVPLVMRKLLMYPGQAEVGKFDSSPPI